MSTPLPSSLSSSLKVMGISEKTVVDRDGGNPGRSLTSILTFRSKRVRETVSLGSGQEVGGPGSTGLRTAVGNGPEGRTRVVLGEARPFLAFS